MKGAKRSRVEVKGPGALRQRCPRCRKLRKRNEPPGDQGGELHQRRPAWGYMTGVGMVCGWCLAGKANDRRGQREYLVAFTVEVFGFVKVWAASEDDALCEVEDDEHAHELATGPDTTGGVVTAVRIATPEEVEANTNTATPAPGPGRG